MIKLSDAQYVIINIGGSSGYNHVMYIIMKDNNVYNTNKFDENNLTLDTEIEASYYCKIPVDSKIVIPSKINLAVMDACHVIIYKNIKNKKLKKVYDGCDVEDSIQKYNKILSHMYYEETYKKRRKVKWQRLCCLVHQHFLVYLMK